MSDFVIIKHNAIKAGLHYDLRFEISQNKFESFAVPKGIPLKAGKRVAAIKTTIHSRKEAFFTGEIPKGEYGGGNLSFFDKGTCEIIKNTKNVIKIKFSGNKVKGLYYLLNVNTFNKSKFKKKSSDKVFMLFKSKS